MADFEHEQLKSLFDRLADRLDKTKGDDQHLAMLDSLRDAITKLQKNLNRPYTGHGQTETMLQEFIKDWQETVSDTKSTNARGALGQGSVLQQYARDRASMEGDTKARERGTKVTDALNSKFKEVSKNLIDFDKGLDGSVAGLTSMLGLSGAASTKIFGAIDDNIQMYRQLRQTGESSVTGIFDMRRAAHAAALSTKQFTDAIINGTDGARLLGAIRFADINKRFRDASASVGRFGMSIDDTIKFQGTYMEMLKDAGVANQMSDGKIAAGMDSLVRSSNITSSILGKTREEVLKERAEAAKDANMALSLRGQGMSPEQIQAIVSQMGDIKASMGVDAARGFRDVVTTGQFQGDNAAFMAKSPEHAQLLMEAGRQARTGKPMDMTALLKQNEEIVKNMDGTRLQWMGALGSLDGTGFEGVNQMVASGLKTDTDKANDGAEKDPAIIQATKFEETMAKMNAAIQSMFTRVIEPLVINHGPKLINFIEKTTNWLEKMSTSTQGLWTVVGTVTAGFLALKLGMAALKFVIVRSVVGSLGIFSKALRGFGGRGGAGFGRLLGGMGGRTAGVVAGRGALAAGGSTLGALGMVGAGVLGVGLSANHVKNNANESFLGNQEGEGGFLSSRAGGYLAAMGTGAAAGAGIGAMGMGVGAIPGALIGGAVGLGGALIGDVWGKDDARKARNMVSPDNTARAPQGASTSRNSTQATPSSLSEESQRKSMELVTTRIANLTEAGNGILRQIQTINAAQLDHMRSELAAAREFYSASLRLNEEANRTLRLAGAVN